MVIRYLVLFVVVSLLIACSSKSEIPPPPSFPSIRGVGLVYVSMSDLEDRVTYIQSQYTPRYSSRNLGIVPQQVSLEGANVTFETKSQQFVFGTAYLVGVDNRTGNDTFGWQYYPFELSPVDGAVMENEGGKWVRGNASTPLNLDSSLLFDGVNHILVWTCSCDMNNDGIFENECTEWKCNNNKWLALEFTALQTSARCGNNQKEGRRMRRFRCTSLSWKMYELQMPRSMFSAP